MHISRRWLVATVCCSSLAFAACKKDESKQGPGAAAPGAKQGGDLALLPVDSEAVIGVNVKQLLASPLWKQFVEPQMMKGDFVAQLAKFKERCGFDPMQTMDRMSIGVSKIGQDAPDGVVVVHGFDKAKSLACVDKYQAEAAAEKVTIKREGDVVIANGEDGAMAFTFLSDTTAVIVFGTGATAAGVKQVTAGSSTLSTSPAFVDMYGKLDAKHTVWAVVNGNAKPFEALGGMGLKPKAVFGSINITDGVAADVRMRLDSADQAAQTAEGFRGQAEAMKSMVDKIEITNDGADVKVVAAASSQKLQSLMSMFAR